VRETRDRRDTIWKMRRGGSRTPLPSPLCRYTHTHTRAHTHTQIRKPAYAHFNAHFNVGQSRIRLMFPLTPDSCVLWFSPHPLTHPHLSVPVSVSKVPVLKSTDLMVEVRPRRVFSNGHTYHVNSISVNSDGETYMSADDLRINIWHLGITDRSFSILTQQRAFKKIMFMPRTFIYLLLISLCSRASLNAFYNSVVCYFPSMCTAVLYWWRWLICACHHDQLCHRIV